MSQDYYFSAQVLGVFLAETAKNIAKGSANALYNNFNSLLGSEITTLGLNDSTDAEEIIKRLEERPDILELVRQKLDTQPKLIEEIRKTVNEQPEIYSKSIIANTLVEKSENTTINNFYSASQTKDKLDITLEPYVDPKTNAQGTMFWAQLAVTNNNTTESLLLNPQIKLDSKIESYPLINKQGFTELSLHAGETKIIDVASFLGGEGQAVKGNEEIKFCFQSENYAKSRYPQTDRHEFNIIFRGWNLPTYSERFVFYVNEQGLQFEKIKDSSENEKGVNPQNPKTLSERFTLDFNQFCVEELQDVDFIPQNSSKKFTVNIARKICYDFNAQSKFVAIFIPATPHTGAFCFHTLATIKEFISYIDERVNLNFSSLGEKDMNIKRTRFTGRVFVYHESDLPEEEINVLTAHYEDKGLNLQFRGQMYEIAQNLYESKK